MLNIAALLSNGMSMPESVQSLICANIIYQSAEDSAEDTLKPRLVIIGHMNKASGSKGVYRGLDSIDITADELLGGDAPQNDVSKPSEAVDKLAKMLCGGAAPCGQIYAALLEAGISKRSVDRTKKQLNVKS
ncbi:hypothetical protein FACS189425_10560 [Clostridia bacterium]|nr:hypothetical protein FACS189425_10560 [Clostridia bacterium]